MDKQKELLDLARLRQRTRWEGYACIGDFHDGAYECDYVSPYTKSAGNVDADVMVMLQDWNSADSLGGQLSQDRVTLGLTPSLPTNRNLVRLLAETFGLELSDVYGTNLFPLIKPNGTSTSIPIRDLVRAANEFALPQVRVVDPVLVICLGVKTFNAMRLACSLPDCPDLESALASPFDMEITRTRVWCQGHTSRLTRGLEQIYADWARMKQDYDRRKSG